MIIKLAIILYNVHIIRSQYVFNRIDHIITKQDENKFSKLRDLGLKDYTADYPTKFPLYLIAKLLAHKSNSTLKIYVSDVRATWDLLSKNFTLKEPAIVPEMAIQGFRNFTPFHQWEKYKFSAEKPSFVQVQSRESNFVYCDLPKWKKRTSLGIN